MIKHARPNRGTGSAGPKKPNPPHRPQYSGGGTKITNEDITYA